MAAPESEAEAEAGDEPGEPVVDLEELAAAAPLLSLETEAVDTPVQVARRAERLISK